MTTLTVREVEMMDALKFAQDFIVVARRYFPKSIHNADRFQLENVCAAVGKAIHNVA